MCFHNRQIHERVELEKRFNAEFMDYDLEYEPIEHYNGFNCPETPIITNTEQDKIQLFHWGLIPAWAKDDSRRRNTLNARSETLLDLPSFKNVVQNRCLVISDGFYEWQYLDPKGKKTQNYLITLPDNALFAFAGLYSIWTNKHTNERIKTYTIVTTGANVLMSEIHNHAKRMPFILTPQQEHEWLGGNDVEPNMELPLQAIPIPSILKKTG